MLSTALAQTTPATQHLISALLKRLHQCCYSRAEHWRQQQSTLSSPTPDSEKLESDPIFPFTESNAKLFVEISRLLYALNVHEVLKLIDVAATHHNLPPADLAHVEMCSAKKAENVNLHVCLNTAILTALGVTAPVSEDAQNEVKEKEEEKEEEKEGVVHTSSALQQWKELCEEVGLQLAMSVSMSLAALDSSSDGSDTVEVNEEEVREEVKEEVKATESQQGVSVFTSAEQTANTATPPPSTPSQPPVVPAVENLVPSLIRILERLLLQATQIHRSVEQAALLTPVLVWCRVFKFT